MDRPDAPKFNKVLVAGASGTIGQALVRVLVANGHKVVALVRPSSPSQGTLEDIGACVRHADVAEPQSLEHALQEENFDTAISCLASRTGAPKDARRIDLDSNRWVLQAARGAGVRHFILLSAICVQKPRLAFQHAKLAFENELQTSGVDFTIVRPTAFFKSLSGQVERIRAGKPYLLFGNGQLTRCKPISGDDLARFIVTAMTDAELKNRIVPIGGPGPAISPKEQGEMLFSLAGRDPRYRSVSPGLLLALSSIMRPLARISGWAAEKAEYLRIAHYYATESMLVWDPETERYSADATPETGEDTLYEHYRRLLIVHSD